MKVLDAVAVIKVVPIVLYGKYKIGQNMRPENRLDLAEKIFKRNSPTAKETLKIMGFEITSSGLQMVDDPVW